MPGVRVHGMPAYWPPFETSNARGHNKTTFNWFSASFSTTSPRLFERSCEWLNGKKKCVLVLYSHLWAREVEPCVATKETIKLSKVCYKNRINSVFANITKSNRPTKQGQLLEKSKCKVFAGYLTFKWYGDYIFSSCSFSKTTYT